MSLDGDAEARKAELTTLESKLREREMQLGKIEVKIALPSAYPYQPELFAIA